MHETPDDGEDQESSNGNGLNETEEACLGNVNGLLGTSCFKADKFTELFEDSKQR